MAEAVGVIYSALLGRRRRRETLSSRCGPGWSLYVRLRGTLNNISSLSCENHVSPRCQLLTCKEKNSFSDFPVNFYFSYCFQLFFHCLASFHSVKRRQDKKLEWFYGFQEAEKYLFQFIGNNQQFCKFVDTIFIDFH